MKLFLTKVLLFLLIIFIAGSSIIFFFIKIKPNIFLGDHNEYFIWNFQMNKMSQKNSLNNNIIIGDSRSMAALDPQIIKHNFINLSIGGSTFLEGFLTIKKVLEKNKIDTIILCYSPMHFTGSDQIFEARTLRFNFIQELDLRYLQNNEKKHRITIDNKSPNLILFIKRKLIQNHFPLIYRASFINNFKFKTNNIPRLKNELTKYNGHCFFGLSDSSNAISEEGDFSNEAKKYYINPVALGYLDSIYQISKKNNSKLFFLIPPLNYSTYKQIKNSNNYLQFLKSIEDLKKLYREIIFIDAIPYLPNSNFGDPSHLNSTGTNFISNYIKQKIE